MDVWVAGFGAGAARARRPGTGHLLPCCPLLRRRRPACCSSRHLIHASSTRPPAPAGGFASDKDVLGQARALVEKLDGAGRKYHSGHYYSAGYDSPFRLIGRHNEVWVLADEQGRPSH
jgi:hypothetical protein